MNWNCEWFLWPLQLFKQIHGRKANKILDTIKETLGRGELPQVETSKVTDVVRERIKLQYELNDIVNSRRGRSQCTKQ